MYFFLNRFQKLKGEKEASCKDVFAKLNAKNQERIVKSGNALALTMGIVYSVLTTIMVALAVFTFCIKCWWVAVACSCLAIIFGYLIYGGFSWRKRQGYEYARLFGNEIVMMLGQQDRDNKRPVETASKVEAPVEVKPVAVKAEPKKAEPKKVAPKKTTSKTTKKVSTQKETPKVEAKVEEKVVEVKVEDKKPTTAKKSTTKKPVVKKATAKKSVVSSAVKKTVEKTTTAKKTTSAKTTVKKPVATTKKPATKKPVATTKKTTAKKSTTK